MKPNYVKGYHPNLLSWNEFENIINIRPLMTQERVHILTSDLDMSWDNDVWTTNPGCYPPSVLEEAIQNYTCWFTEMSRSTETLNNATHKLEQEFNSAVDAHIYSCRNLDYHPFGIHFDRSDNVIVQCEGTTHWKIWGEVFDREQYSKQMNIVSDPVINTVMEPGDAVFIPAYHPHLATTMTPRLSVSFAMPVPTEPWGGIYQERHWVRL
tara:strand:- start:441 stop:1070 length:630 start_codon:yes stop_codon:yes gene_type:complete